MEATVQSSQLVDAVGSVNAETAAKMTDAVYRLGVLKMLLEKRFLTNQVNIADTALLAQIDNSLWDRASRTATDVENIAKAYVEFGLKGATLQSILAELKQSASALV